MYLQMAICYKTWFGFLFYPISFLLLVEKVRYLFHCMRICVPMHPFR